MKKHIGRIARRRKLGGGVFLALFLACLFGVGNASADDSMGVRSRGGGETGAGAGAGMEVKPRGIDIGTFYNGTSITVTGAVPEDSEVIVRFMGAAHEVHTKQKGKVFGIMWMNLQSITFKGAPSVCLVNSAVDLDALAAGSGAAASVASLRLSGIEELISIESENCDRPAAFREFVKLKKSEGLYRELAGNVSYEPASSGSKKFRAEIPIPSRLVAGDYVVEMAAISDGKIVARVQTPVVVKLVGFPALLFELAFGHALLFGILATVIAILAGLAIGLVFQSKGAH